MAMAVAVDMLLSLVLRGTHMARHSFSHSVICLSDSFEIKTWNIFVRMESYFYSAIFNLYENRSAGCGKEKT